MRKLMILGTALLVSGCAMTPQQREGLQRFGQALGDTGDAMRANSPSRQNDPTPEPAPRMMKCTSTWSKPAQHPGDATCVEQ